MSLTHRSVLAKVYEAFNAADADALDQLFHDDAVMSIPGETQISGVYHGKAEILGIFARMAQLTDGTSRAEVRRITLDDDGGVVIAVDAATRFGEQVTAEFADVYTLRDGAVSELRVFPADPAAMTYFWRD
ncbi:nuclear transport factor 2 family protein [Isoptericola halotolerans]|uniref:nuclear transport factor 2 family protein n=1 Tax=Isoptericola halotolerans TaxID=300560 RepID=UPI00388EA299